MIRKENNNDIRKHHQLDYLWLDCRFDITVPCPGTAKDEYADDNVTGNWRCSVGRIPVFPDQRPGCRSVFFYRQQLVRVDRLHYGRDAAGVDLPLLRSQEVVVLTLDSKEYETSRRGAARRRVLSRIKTLLQDPVVL